MNTRIGPLVLLALLVAVTGCGGGGTNNVAVPVRVFLSPFAANLNQGETRSFTATVTGTSNTAVNWAVVEGAAGGSITNTGAYTAPNTSGTFHVIATSQADAAKAARATVNVAAVVISLNPNAVTIDVGNQFPFAATVTGTVNTAVSWTIQEGTSGGSVNSSGLYTAPGANGVFHVIAASQADTTQMATAKVTVATLVVTVSPASDVLGPLGVRTFSATVNTSLDASVTWSVVEAAGGAITASGKYTAPNTTGGPFHVVATSVQDPSKSASSAVTTISSGFRPTGSMRDPRSGQTATLLNTGKLLVAGGDACHLFAYYYGSCPLNTAEIYDPTGGTFSMTGTMAVQRLFHTATLLPDGKVLVAGGTGASAERYDPAAGTFSNTGSMSVGRESHTATLLSNGKVLIAGGQNVSGALATAELYDPSAGTFTATGSMAAGRNAHTATLLGTGKVLIVGGSNSTGELATAELYDPATGNFTPANSMLSKRTFHTATPLSNGNVLVTGGMANGVSLSGAEVYDVIAGSFTATGPMMTARDSHFAVLLANGAVLVAGGISGGTDFTAELYDPVTQVFTQTGSMGVGRVLAAAALLPDGRALVTGGSDLSSGSDLNSAEVYK